MPTRMQAGDVLAERYRLEDLLAEDGEGRFWRAHDLVLRRAVAVHILAEDDERAPGVLEAARRAGPVINRRLLRVLDAESAAGVCFVVNEWGRGDSLDILLTREGPLSPRRAAWLVSEVADSIAEAHRLGQAHGYLAPENVLIDHNGQVRIIGFGVDAALRGLPPGRTASDEVDLAGLLYCALTGKWPGVTPSAIPAAPEAHGEVLRPRQVRAGIPRVLDAICDQALNPRGTSNAPQPSAQRIRDQLADYVGEMTGAFSPVLGTPTIPAPVPHPRPAHPYRPLTADPAETDPAETPAPAADPAETHAAPEVDPSGDEPPQEQANEPAKDQPEPPLSSTDLPTEAGMPVFHDDDVDWLRARAEKPAPPPELPAPAPKPLFAPDPPEGQPVRRPRPGSRAANTSTSGPEYWPWEGGETGNAAGSAGRDTGSWGSGSWTEDRWGTGDVVDTGDRVPGRRWNRLALALCVLLLLGLAVVAAYQLGLKPAEEPQEQTESSTTETAAPAPIDVVSADDFDPQGTDGRQENPDSVPNILDGDTATSWTTSTYRQNLGPGGLKTGVGVVLDLGGTRAVRQVLVTVAGGTTAMEVYVTTDPPAGINGLSPVGIATGDGEVSVNLAEAVSGQYVTIWLTQLPAVDDGFRGTISEVQVLG